MSKKKNNKKNLKKVQAKIGTTPVKAEAAKKEESKAAVKNTEIAAAKDDAKAIKKAEKKVKEFHVCSFVFEMTGFQDSEPGFSCFWVSRRNAAAGDVRFS